MATLSITIPEVIKDRVLDGFCYQNGYQDNIIDIEGNETPNTVSKAQFAKQCVKNYVKNSVKAYEAKLADQARLDAIADVEQNITLED